MTLETCAHPAILQGLVMTQREEIRELVMALGNCVTQLEIVLPTNGRVHDERQALIDARALLAKHTEASHG